MNAKRSYTNVPKNNTIIHIISTSGLLKSCLRVSLPLGVPSPPALPIYLKVPLEPYLYTMTVGVDLLISVFYLGPNWHRTAFKLKIKKFASNRANEDWKLNDHHDHRRARTDVVGGVTNQAWQSKICQGPF